MSVNPANLGLQRIRKYLYWPTFIDPSTIPVTLSGYPPWTALVYNGTLHLKTDNGIEVIDISAVPPSSFLNAASIAEAADGITDMLKKPEYQLYLSSVLGYTIKTLSQGERFTVPFEAGLASFVVSKKTNNYFDFEALFPDGNNLEQICYGTKTHTGFTHSGDVGALMQSITVDNSMIEGKHFVLTVVGYKREQLRNFKEQHPAIIIVNHSTKTLSIVPCPLDQATMDNDNLAALVVGKLVGREIKYVVLPAPITVAHVNTGEISDPVKDVAARAVSQAEDVWNRLVEPITQVTQDVAVTRVIKNVESVKSEPDKVNIGPQTIIAEQRLIVPGANMIISDRLINLAGGYTPDNQAGKTLLPVLGRCEGACPSLALGRPYEGTTKLTDTQLHSQLNRSNPIIHISDKWSEQVGKVGSVLVNGVWIVYPTLNNSTPNLQDATRTVLEEYLNNVNIAGVSAMAGSNSIVLVAVKGRFYWYRGVRYLGLIDKTPDFGDDVTEKLHPDKIKEWALKGIKLPWVNVYQRNVAPLVCFDDKMTTTDNVATLVSDMSIEQISTSVLSINDLLTQLQIILDPEQLEKVVKGMIDALGLLVDNTLKKTKQSIEDALKSGASLNDEAVKILIASLKAAKRELNRSIQPLINRLGQLTSLQGASKRVFNIKQMQRKAQIANNVDRVKNMSMSDKMDLLDKCCTELGVLIAQFSPVSLQQALKAVSEGQLVTKLPTLSSMIDLDSRTLTLDPCTIGVMLELTVTNPSQYNSHPLAPSNPSVASGLSFPLTPNGKISSMPFPLFDNHVNLNDPKDLVWVAECNGPDVSTFRIDSRGTIANSTATRDCTISASSKDLGLFLVHTLLSTMERLTSQISTVPDPVKDWNNSTSQIMRGLFGQLLTLLASGGSPLSMAWQMVMDKTALNTPSNNEIWIYTRLATMFKYTCWPDASIKKNMKLLIAHMLRRSITGPVVAPMLKKISDTKKASQTDRMEARNRELHFLKLAIETLFIIAKEDSKGTSKKTVDIAERLLTKLPDNIYPRDGTKSLIFLLEQISSGGPIKDQFTRVLQIALNIFTKRSACFKPIKEKLAETIGKEKLANTVATDNVTDLLAEYEKIKSDLTNRAKISDTTPDIHVQNSKAIDSKNGVLIKADAELKRTPWSVNGNEYDPLEFEKDLKWVLNGVVIDHNKDNKDNHALVKVVKHPVLTAIDNVAGNDWALELYTSTNLTNVSDQIANKLPVNDVTYLLSEIGVTKDRHNQILLDSVHSLLKDWRADTVEADQHVVNLLM